ncbi:hypothetical protein LJB85_01375 [Porphyromonadaceae bacterium OttesenSCG-928-L07]|nr:hypothetical protein [Porphyromonadaceae bacterium OttesenSCG-928-L07]
MLLSFFCVIPVLNLDAQTTRHERQLDKYKTGWNKLIPTHTKLQYAGAMGLISAGIGWDHGTKGRWETDLFLGYLPKFDGDEGHVTITLKENYIPWCIDIPKSSFQFEPFTISLYINKIFGDKFWTKEPDKYPTKYYNVATNLRFNIAFGQRVNLKLKPLSLSDELTLFYEVGTNDLYVVSYFTNNYLSVTDIFSLSIGLKFQFM